MVPKLNDRRTVGLVSTSATLLKRDHLLQKKCLEFSETNIAAITIISDVNP